MFSVKATIKKDELDSLLVFEIYAEVHEIRKKIERRIKENFLEVK